MSISRAARFGGISLAAALLFGPGVAWADNPHFISATDSVQSDGDLLVQWKEAGLGSSVTIAYDISATGQSFCNCVTKGGTCPSAQNKTTGSQLISVPATFTSTKAGNINGSATLMAPACPTSSPPTCGKGQTLEVTLVTWSDPTVKDTTTPVGPFPATPTSQTVEFVVCGK